MEIKTLEQLSLLDSFLFGSALSYKDYGKEVSHIILKTILGRDVKIRAVNPEKVIFPSKPGLHGVRLDAFIDVDGDPENYSKDLVQLLTYMKNSIPENACNPDLEELHSYIDKVKKDPNVQEVYMTFEEYVEREKEEERKRADAAEKAAAEANDRAYKADQRIVTSIRKLMNVSGSSPDDAMDTLGIEADMRDYYKAML